jgi:magnesium-transporting ATPase (P-type)
MQHFGKILMIVGLISLVAGLVIYFAGDKPGWPGHLPGDIHIEKKNFSFYFPFTTMILISIVITLIIRLIRRFF